MTQSLPLPLPPASYIPAYLGDVTYDWPYNGVPSTGQPGNDVNVATANATGYYEPKNQGNKASMLGLRLAVDLTTPSGWVDPQEPYGPAPTPVLDSLDPPSVAIPVTEDFVLHFHGSNFMPSSQIEWNGVPDRTTFVSETEVTTIVRASGWGPGVVPVAVWNANKRSALAPFTFTAA